MTKEQYAIRWEIIAKIACMLYQGHHGELYWHTLLGVYEYDV
jgi:hypothetical protein